MLTNILRKHFGHTEFYKFCSWLKGEYYASIRTQYCSEQFCFFGKGVEVANGVKINRPDRVILKDYANIATGTMINSKGGLHVGRYSGIGYNCVIWTSEHHYRGAKTIPFDNGSDLKPVIIRDFVWIGSNVKILPGKEIGEGSIIGLGSVVSKDVPPLAIVFGNPAEIVGYRNKKHFEQCKKENLYSPHMIGNNYVERMFPLYKKKFRKELEDLDLIDF